MEKYREILEKLGVKAGMPGVIFKGARCEINNPAHLKQLIVNLLDKVDWLSLPVDVKGTIYEDLLKRDKLSLDLFWIKDKSLTDRTGASPQGRSVLSEPRPAGRVARFERRGGQALVEGEAGGRTAPPCHRPGNGRHDRSRNPPTKGNRDDSR